MPELTRELLIEIHMANGMTREQAEAKQAYIEAPQHKVTDEDLDSDED